MRSSIGPSSSIASLRASETCRVGVLETVDQTRQRIGTAIEDEIVAEFAYRSLDLEVGGDVLGVDERAVEAGFDAVVEEDRVEGGARRRL